MQPTPSNIAATLGPRPGNTLRPPPNQYNLYSWSPKGKLSLFKPGERVALSTRTLADFEGKVDFYVVESKIDTEPEILAGIDLNEIMTKE
jgi:hypothetical protein